MSNMGAGPANHSVGESLKELLEYCVILGALLLAAALLCGAPVAGYATAWLHNGDPVSSADIEGKLEQIQEDARKTGNIDEDAAALEIFREHLAANPHPDRKTWKGWLDEAFNAYNGVRSAKQAKKEAEAESAAATRVSAFVKKSP